MGSITDEENKKIVELRSKVEDLLLDEYTNGDLYLIRWLRARDLNLEAAETMLRNHYKWRAERKIDALLASSPDDYFPKNFPSWLNGIDTKGRPVLCVPMADWDVRLVVEDDRVAEFEDYINRLYERVMECIRKYNEKRKPDEEPITQFTCIVNWDKFSVRQTSNLKAVQTLLGCAAVYEAHYPEILAQAFFLNTNPVFQILFALMKPILAPRTLSKIQCYGSNRSEWEPVVRAAVEEHQIPRQFGG
ncbi:SEC14-like protein 2 [Orchesella cincta]|uniref:SEC14-like protein 2 n=1 Tax=Orchesella cincta TaxID=48709 RepID=A0A1D2NIU9_ORCCI|nr:SEC14-like protein 2 [Orchesella cincta]